MIDLVTQRIVSTDKTLIMIALPFIQTRNIVKLAIKSSIGFFPRHSYLSSDERDQFARVEDQGDNSVDRDLIARTQSCLSLGRRKSLQRNRNYIFFEKSSTRGTSLIYKVLNTSYSLFLVPRFNRITIFNCERLNIFSFRNLYLIQKVSP